MTATPMTVVETEEFLRAAKPLFSDEERGRLVDFLAMNPEAGLIMAETGGVRKLRWAMEGRGKRGGARVIYYYHNLKRPLFILSAFPKNEKANLNKAERSALKRAVSTIITAGPAKRRS
jgi:hypothetical protein